MKQIGILSATPGAGAKTVAALFACYLASEEKKEPAVLELCSNALYNGLGLDKRFAGKDFFAPGGPPNKLWGVNWQLQPKPLLSQITEDRLYRLSQIFRRVEGDVMLCVVNGMPYEEQKTLLADMDYVLLLLDPMPSKILSLPSQRPEIFRFISNQLRQGKNARYIPVVNKMNDGVKLYQIQSFLGLSKVTTVPFLDSSLLYRAEYSCRPPYTFGEIQKEAKSSMRELWEKVSG